MLRESRLPLLVGGDPVVAVADRGSALARDIEAFADLGMPIDQPIRCNPMQVPPPPMSLLYPATHHVGKTR